MLIYKYCSINKEIIDSIKNGLFRFTQADELNDRFEGNWANNNNQISYEKLNTYTKELENSGEINPFEISSSDIIHLCSEMLPIELTPYVAPGLFTGSDEEKEKYKEQYKKAILSIIECNTKEYCVFSVSESFSNQLLWAHYGKRETGIVVGFNADNIYFKDLKKVSYTNIRPDIKNIIEEWKHYSDFDKEEEINEWIYKSFCTKSKCWEYEKEFRLIKPINEANEHRNHNTVHLYKIPFEAWDSIYYGSELDSEFESNLQRDFFRSCDKKHIRRIKVLKDIETYSYQYVDR